MSEQPGRPGQATFAGWLIIGGSIILVMTAWQRISSLHTLEFREELQQVLSEPPLAGTGLGFETLKTTIRVLSMVAAGAATASAILGFQALRRSTSARLALSLLAPLILIGGLATAGFFAPLVVAGVIMLWARPTRDWFAGRPWVPAAAGAAARRPDPFAQAPRQEPPQPAPGGPEGSSGSAEPRPEPGPYEQRFGEPSADQHGVETAPGRTAVPARRPGAVTIACVVVWISAFVVSAVMLMFAAVMAFARDEFFAEIERQGSGFDMQDLSRAELATGTYIATAVVVAWCLTASVLAVLVFRRVAWARIALVVSATVAAVLCLAATLVNPLLVLLLGAASVTVWLLLRGDVAAWFKRE